MMRYRLMGLPLVLAFFMGLALHPLMAAGSPSDGLPTEFRPSLPLFDHGPLFNLKVNGKWDDRAVTNASAHAAWSLAVPLLGQEIGGRKGLWIAGLSWIALSFVTEAFFHAPPGPTGPAYAAEVRTDIASKVLPCAGILVWDLFRSHDGT